MSNINRNNNKNDTIINNSSDKFRINQKPRRAPEGAPQCEQNV
jgi:hypothetical protein